MEGDTIQNNTKEHFVIDRIENEVIAIETKDKKIININKNKIFGEFKEGDILIKIEEKYYVDKEESKRKTEEMNNLMKGLWVK